MTVDRTLAGPGKTDRQQRNPPRLAQRVSPPGIPSSVFELQHVIGNQAVQRTLRVLDTASMRPLEGIEPEELARRLLDSLKPTIRAQLAANAALPDGHKDKLNLPGLDSAGLEWWLDGLMRVVMSPIDYGTINPDDPNHLEVLFFNTHKQLLIHEEFRPVTEPYVSATSAAAQEAAVREAQQAEAADWEYHKAQFPLIPEERIVKTAYLGAGAAMAYHIASNRGGIDPSDSVLIGKLQPWAGERGGGVIGHPMHMVTPMLEFIGAPVSEQWASREDLSEVIEEVFERSHLRRVDADVLFVSKVAADDYAAQNNQPPGGKTAERGLYQIICSDRVLYARDVVMGLGMGGHKLGASVQKEDVATSAEDLVNTQAASTANRPRRAMDMDTFTRIAGKIRKIEGSITIDESLQQSDVNRDITVVLGGGNAALDVAFDALNKGFQVEWLTGGSGASFLSGFFNYAAYVPYLKALKQGFENDPPVGMNRQERNNVGKLGKDDLRGKDDVAKLAAIDAELNRVTANNFEYLRELYSGQNPSVFTDVVNRFTAKTFKGVYQDRANNYAATDTGVSVTTVGQRTVSGDVYVYAQGPALTPLEVLDLPLLQSLVRDADLQQQLAGGADPLATGWISSPEADADKSSLRVIGSQAARVAEKREGGSAELSPEGLPGNVAVADQLTAIRAREQAAAAFMPLDIGQRVNFTVDLRSQIATHISAKYARLADELRDLDRLVDLIIASRKKPELAKDTRLTQPALPPYQKDFQAFWETKLGELNANPGGAQTLFV